jgi:lysophospholipase L1-like esterase
MKKLRIPFLALAALALVGAWAYAQTTNAAPPGTAPIRVACVGDSITEGAGGHHPYPAQLQKLLGDGWLVKNFGVGGRTLLKKGDHPYWIEKAFAQAKDFAPNVVVLMLGTNDTKPQNWRYFSEFPADYKELVETFKNLPSAPKIFVCRPIPVFGAGNYDITEANLEQEMPIIDQIAQSEGATVIDLHAALAGQPHFVPDRVHPNDAGYAILAQTVANALTGK